MSRFYVACQLGTQMGRVLLGTLHNQRLTLSEVRSFPNTPIQDKEALQWNIPQLYQELMEALRTIGSYEEPVAGISCTSWGGDYLLFGTDGSLLTPAVHHADRRAEAGKKEILSRISWETLYEETGMQQLPASSVFQLATEPSKRLKRSAHFLPMADGFNFLLSNVAKAEKSLASTTLLYNPATGAWSEMLAESLRLPSTLLAPLVPAGTELGPLRADIAKETRLDEARVLATCSHDLAAALVGLPLNEGEDWAFLRPGKTTLFGTQLGEPLINQASRDLGFSNETGYGESVCFYKETVGLSILEECQAFWKQSDRETDAEMLSHLAGSAAPFESLIDPCDPRFNTPGDMPLKIQAFCKETGQPVPRKPGPIFRCILESLALSYRRCLQELELYTGKRFARLFMLGKSDHPLLSHFTANALQIPAVIIGDNAPAVGNLILQSLALRHVESIAQARQIVQTSFKHDTILPHANAWDAAFERLVALTPA